MLLEKSERRERENGLEAPKGARRTPKCPPPEPTGQRDVVEKAAHI